MAKKQKVRFFKGDQKPAKGFDLFYSKKMKKKGRSIIWQVLEKPTNKIVANYFFEEDADRLVKFQNKHKVWINNGGIPSFLYIDK
jgi:hypothetical protein